MSEVKFELNDRASSGLLVLFVGLKLTGFINWPWVWILAPLWIPMAMAGAYLLLRFLTSDKG